MARAMPSDELPTVAHGTAVVGPLELRWAAASHVGAVRSINEDSVLCRSPVFAVADGMGGHRAGDVASSVAVESLSSLAAQPVSSTADVRAAVLAANAAVYQRSLSEVGGGEMGTTAVGLAFVETGVAVLFNVGDSRCYRYAMGRLEQLSTDHSYVQELVDRGVIAPAEAQLHPERNVITRALGIAGEVQVDVEGIRPVARERFLLCSDGLTSEVDDATIRDVLATQAHAEDTVARLIALALLGGGRDNVTAVVIDVVALDLTSDDDTAPRPIVVAELADGGIGGVPDELQAARAPTIEEPPAGELIADVPAPSTPTPNDAPGPRFEAPPATAPPLPDDPDAADADADLDAATDDPGPDGTVPE